MLYDLVDFDATAEKRRIQEKLLNNDMNLCLLEIMRDSLIALRDYPKNGQLYYRLLKYRYFEAGNALYVTVYSSKRQAEKGTQMFSFSYLPEDGDGTYDIVNDSDKFMLKLEK